MDHPLLPQRCPGRTASYTQLGLIFSLFALWGACNSLNDVLIRTFKAAFGLSDMASSLVQTAFYFGYLFGGLPAAFVSRRFGYKTCVCTGLALVCTGALLFWPCSATSGSQYFGALLLCLYLLAFGLAFLECSANPWIVLLAERRKAGSGTRALNLAQSFNPLGAVGGVLLGRQVIFGASQPQQIAAVGLTYLILAALFGCVLAAFLLVRFPAGDGRAHTNEGATRRCNFAALCLPLQRRGFAFGLLAQFLNIGAQTCVWSFTIRYVRTEVPGSEDQRAADALLLSLCCFLAGRFTSTCLLRWTAADRLLAAQCFLAALGCVTAVLAGGVAGASALVLVSGLFGMAFPTIFALAMQSLDAETSEVGASLLVMSIIGGALVTPCMGLVSDATGSVRVAYIVPALCFLVVAAYGHTHARRRLRVLATARAPGGEAELHCGSRA